MMSRASRILKWVGAGTVLLAAAPIAYADPPASVPAAPGPFAGSCGFGPENRAQEAPAMLPSSVGEPAYAGREAGDPACGDRGAAGAAEPVRDAPGVPDVPEYAGTVTVTLPRP